MTSGEKQNLIDAVSAFSRKNLENLVEMHYPGQDWDAETFEGGQSINNLIQVIIRIIGQLRLAVEGEDYSIYPNNYVSPSMGASQLIVETTNIIYGVNQKRPFQEFLIPIKWLTRYLLEHDLWNKSRKDLDAIDLDEKQIKILSLLHEIEGIVSNIKITQGEIHQQKGQMNEVEKSLTEFIEQKKQELSAISDAVPTVQNQKNEVDNVLKNVQQADSEIRTVQKNHQELFEQLKTSKDNQEKEFKDAFSKYQEDFTKIKTNVEEGNNQIAFFKSLEGFIKEKQAEIVELGGMAAGAALGGTFGLRGGKIEKRLGFWRIAVPTITVLAMAWVVIVFTCLKSKTDEVFVNVLLDLAKTVPAFVLMGFVFKQYTKERHLEEEYAFKAAVANTIKAYSDLLKNEDKNDNKSRQAMLAESVKLVQTPPKIHADNPRRLFSFSTRHLANSIKNLNETLDKTVPKTGSQ